MLVKPDIAYIEDLAQSGGSDLKKCYQCATCSVICPLSPELKPYPRKEMIWASWGLKGRLAADPDLWLCHQCGDCSVQCPRGARPGDVMAALRGKTIEHFAFPAFMGKLTRHPRYLPILAAISAFFIGVMLLVQQLWEQDAPLLFLGSHFEYEQFLAHKVLILFFFSASFLMVVFAAISASRFWKAMDKLSSGWSTAPVEDLRSSVIGAAMDLIKHSRFHRCDSGKQRRSGHLLVFYGFVGLFVTTSIATVLTFLEYPLNNPDLYPLGWFHPVKILGNAGGIALLAGCFYVWNYRRNSPDHTGESSYSDWFFLALLFMVGATGIFTEVVRLTAVPSILGTPVYVVHLLAVFWLLIFLPYTKFAHIFYRFLAMIHARLNGRRLPDAPAQ